MSAATRIYLDHNASAPLRPAARDAMLAALALPGNASSVHAEGRAARALISDARRSVASLVGADPRGVVFTASATEAANLALTPSFAVPGRAPPVRLLIGATEHACVLAGHRWGDAQIVPVDASGVIDLVALETIVAATGGPVMLALQAANNETGVLQPVCEAATIVHRSGGILICDAVQAAGRVPLDLQAVGADAVILSSHKIGGPKGAGALIFADPRTHIAAALLRGGGQESGLRAGTEDVAAIAGFGAACAEIQRTGEAEAAVVQSLRDAFEAKLQELVPSAVAIGVAKPRLRNTSCVLVPHTKAVTLLMALDLAGIAVSTGSACSSGKIARSHVLDAMGIDPHMIDAALRISFGWTSCAADVGALIKALASTLSRSGHAQAA